MNEFKLLILGSLWKESMHVYHFQEKLRLLPKGSWSLLKPTAWYHHFSNLETEGLLQSLAPIQEGNRPPRKVFSLTPLGENRLVEMLKESYDCALDQWSLIVNFIRVLTPTEQAALLEKRLQWLATVKDFSEVLDLHVREWYRILVQSQTRWIKQYQVTLSSAF